MSFPRYPKYKASGVEWLGDVPEHWGVGPLRRSIEFLTDYEANGSFADTKENVAIDIGEPYAWYVRATDLEQRRFGLVEGNRFCDQATFNWLTKTSLRGGELLVAKRGEIGKVYVMPTYGGNATLAPNLYLIRLNQNLQPRYAWYWFSVDPGKAELVLADKSTTIGALYKDDVKSCFVATPSTAEQTRIVEFLDRETGKIDELVAEQQRLMELLKEKRQAVISHAVTKGLNPRAPMKPSNIEWLGDVPAHWEVPELKRIATIQTGVAKGKDNGSRSTVSVPYLRVANVQDGYLDLEDVATIEIPEDDLSRYALRPGDVLMNEGGDFDKLGRGCVWNGQIDPCISQNHVFAVRPRDGLSAWVAAFTGSGPAQFYFMSRSKQSTNLASISSTNLMELPVTLPPATEREAILGFVTEQTSKLAALAAEAQKAIDLLQERRTALISAAVTGQIDVRKLA